MLCRARTPATRALPCGFAALLSFAVVALPGCARSDPTPAADAGPGAALSAEFAARGTSLSDADKAFFESLMADFLFDPKGAQRVSATIRVRDDWAKTSEETVTGWLVPGVNGQPGFIYFAAGSRLCEKEAKDVKKVDFAAESRWNSPTPLADAAWLYRLGEERQAVVALAGVRGKDDAREQLRDGLAAQAFADMVHAYMVRADDEALSNAEALVRLFKGKMPTDYAQAPEIVADLHGRQKKGTFGKAPPDDLPADFAKWNDKKKTAFLIAALDEVDAGPVREFGGVNLRSDRRVAALIELGEIAVPALLNSLESDRRLTRSVNSWQHSIVHPVVHRTVLSVREAALTALRSILRLQAFEVYSAGDKFTGRGEVGVKEMARRLRAHWKEAGDVPFSERMMRMLTDPKASPQDRRFAAENLSRPPDGEHFHSTMEPSITFIGDLPPSPTISVIGGPPPKPNPAVAKFSKPTAAEAMLAALDAELKSFAPKPDKAVNDYERRRATYAYQSALVLLNDRWITPELVRRAAAAPDLGSHRAWAVAAIRLGEPKPLSELAEAFAAGKLAFPASSDGGNELRDVVFAFMEADLPETRAALDALVDAKHPQHRHVTRAILEARLDDFPGSAQWLAHPFSLRVLREALNDALPTGATYSVAQGSLVRRENSSSMTGPLPDFLANRDNRREFVPIRVCDVAGERLSELLLGAPQYHPLLKDADKRLEELKETVDRFNGKWRLSNWLAFQPYGLNLRRPFSAGQAFPWGPVYIPDLRPLGRAATAADVRAGAAIFHLNGQGKPVDLKLPGFATRKADGKNARPTHVLILQAEVGPDGALTLGTVGPDGIRATPGTEVTDIKSLAEAHQERTKAIEEWQKRQSAGKVKKGQPE